MSRAATARDCKERNGYRGVNSLIMRRSLVTTDESARHPFLASLAPHVRAGTKPVPARSRWRLTADDIKGFFAAYVACTIGALLFIS